MKMTEQDFANHPSDTAMADKYFREAEYFRSQHAHRDAIREMRGTMIAIQDAARRNQAALKSIWDRFGQSPYWDEAR